MTESINAAVSRLAYTINEAAESLGVSRSTMSRMVANGDVETVTFGRSRRVPRSALAALVGGDPAWVGGLAADAAKPPVQRTMLLVEIDTLAGREPEVRVFLNGTQVLR
jgi:excisionase family DNA binding protein